MLLAAGPVSSVWWRHLFFSFFAIPDNLKWCCELLGERYQQSLLLNTARGNGMPTKQRCQKYSYDSYQHEFIKITTNFRLVICCA